MRRRITLLFVLLFLLVAVIGYGLRSWTVERDVRAHDDALLHREVSVLATAVDERMGSGASVDAAFLRAFAARDVGIRFHPADGPDIEIHGPGFTGSLEPDDGNTNVWATAPTTGDGFVLLSEDDSAVRTAVYPGLPSIVVLLLLAIAISGLGGYLLARSLERPFGKLALAAEELGRGRFQLDLPTTSVPEARAIGQALHASARQLRDRLAAEDEFAQRASHALRTPLTGLRLELEDAMLHDGMPTDAAAAVERSLQRIDQLDAVTGELVSLARRRALVADATIPLRVLARQVTRRWVDELVPRHRELSVAVEGDATTTYTPGPVEQILELLLIDVMHRSAGPVRLVLAAAAEGHLRITVTAAARASARTNGTAPLTRARTVALALGGRLEGEYAGGGVEIVLPRR
jgi:hypothetical protein